jgi:hypothetical protein
MSLSSLCLSPYNAHCNFLSVPHRYDGLLLRSHSSSLEHEEGDSRPETSAKLLSTWPVTGQMRRAGRAGLVSPSSSCSLRRRQRVLICDGVSTRDGGVPHPGAKAWSTGRSTSSGVYQIVVVSRFLGGLASFAVVMGTCWLMCSWHSAFEAGAG